MHDALMSAAATYGPPTAREGGSVSAGSRTRTGVSWILEGGSFRVMASTKLLPRYGVDEPETGIGGGGKLDPCY